MAEPSMLVPIELAGSRLRFVVDNMPATAIAASALHGLGLFARRGIRGGEVLGGLDGQLVDWTSFAAMHASGVFGADADNLFMEWNALSTDVLLARPFRTKYSFINHSRTPNAELATAPLRVVANCAIAQGCEITLDYRREPLRREYLDKADYL